MSNRERGILIGLAIVLMAGIVFIVIKAREGRTPDEGGPVAGGTWDTSRFPNLGEMLREDKTPGGVIVQVFSEGKGEPVEDDQAMDVSYVGYSAVSGAIFDRGVMRALKLNRGGVIPGMIEGLRGIRPREKRRLLIPSDMAYGGQRAGNIAPHSDLAFDVEWVRLEKDDLKVGTGAVAKRGSTVRVHYKGQLENGTVFDSSYERNTPAEFQLRRGSVIAGWVHGLQGMREGGVRNLWIPSHLAYGAQSKGKIPPHSNLLFVVELLEVK